MNSKQKRSLFRIALSSVLFIIAIFLPIRGWLRLLICIVPYLIAGYDVLMDAAVNIINGQVFDEKFLMSIASVGAFAVGEYYEAVFVMIFFRIGEFFESIAVGKSRASVAALMDICPEYANIEKDGVLISLPPDEVDVGEIIVIKPGERVPLDGIVCEGYSALNTSALTGESMPRDVSPGDEVISGCVNLNSSLKVKVSKVFADSTVSRILELVEQSASHKSKSENFIRQFARWYTPVVVICAVVLAVIPSLIFGSWTKWIHRALTFLVISCPCALVISVPLTYFGGIGKASREGILIKGSNYLDALALCDTFVFDKTGTLTQGCFSVKEIIAQGCSEEELLEKAAYAECLSSHPIALSLKEAYGKTIRSDRVEAVSEEAGFGVKAILDGKEIAAGHSRLMKKHGLEWLTPQTVGTVIHVAWNNCYLGCIVISDSLKPDARDTVERLKAQGISKIMLLTGDDSAAAGNAARELGINDVRSRLLPADKLDIIAGEISGRSSKGLLAFVGDGMNDAPALTRADVGIAMGALGSDAAIEAADIVLMDDKPSKINSAIDIARKTRVIVKQNIAFSLAVKFAVLLLGAFGLAGLWAAAFADVGVCLIAVLNAMRTMK